MRNKRQCSGKKLRSLSKSYFGLSLINYWIWIAVLPFIFLIACSSSRSSFTPYKNYSPQQLQKDFQVYQETLEEAHPGLYWYTSKDSMDAYFQWGKDRLRDSLNEPEFRRILAYITSKINCGHTAIRSSKQFLKYQDTVRINRIFPLSFKIWKDTAVILANLNRRDSILKRGTIVTSINQRPMKSIVDSFFNFIGTDGYNLTYKYQAISNRGSFGSLYSALYGFPLFYTFGYLDSTGHQLYSTIRPYVPVIDTGVRRPPTLPISRVRQPSRKERKNIRRNSVRLLKIDSVNHTAMMDLNSFSRGFGLKKFFRKSFKALRKNEITHLIIDVRNNSGGSPNNSTLISQYISDHRFKIGDSLYAITKHKKYKKYIKGDYWNRVFMTFFTKKRKDGNYHLGYFERHYFKPIKKNHFDGQSYILISGNSFSATTLFTGTLIKQDNVTVIGEETGGGAYGNTAWQIPTLTLPETQVRLNLPLYRLVIDTNYPKTGRGIQPEFFVPTTINSIRERKDPVLEKALALIKENKEMISGGARTSGN